MSSNLPSIRLSEQAAIRLSLGYAAYCVIAAGAVLASLADRRGAPSSDVRVRLSNMPRAHVPVVCGLILIAAGVLSVAKLVLLQGLPELLSAMRGAL
jgi:hypothetical protein